MFKLLFFTSGRGILASLIAIILSFFFNLFLSYLFSLLICQIFSLFRFLYNYQQIPFVCSAKYTAPSSSVLAFGLQPWLFQSILVAPLLFSRLPQPGPLVFKTFLKLGKLQCKSNFNRNEVLLLMIENFETIQIV